MRVRCVSDYVTPEQRAALGRRPYQGHLAWGLTIGEEYLVLGLTFEADPDHSRTGPYVSLLLHNGDALNVLSYDLCLFEITEPRASRFWEVQSREFGGRQIVNFMPPELADEVFPSADAGRANSGSWDHEDDAWFAFLASDAFRRLCELLQAESTGADVSSGA